MQKPAGATSKSPVVDPPEAAANIHGQERVIYEQATQDHSQVAGEAAERAFWDKNDSKGYLDWKKVQLTVFPDLKPSTQTISLRILRHLLIRSRQLPTLAVPYQSLIKVWLQEKLQGS
jgi:hypothetical protein